MPRETYARGRTTVLYFMIALIAVGLVFTVVSWLFLERLVLSRLARLSSDVRKIADSSDPTARVSMTGRDELSALSSAINGMLEALERAQTERKRAEEEIRRHRDQLEKRTREFAAVNKELEAFSYSVAHDLRAPLRSIDGFSHALLEDYADKLDSEGKGYLRRVRAASQHMAQLIDDLLTLSRVTRSEMRPTSVDLSSLAQAIAAELQQVHPGRHVELAITQGLVTKGDPHLLRVVLENLLGNAWKFTGKQAYARIELGVTQDNGKLAYFVRDNGVGFDMAYAEKLFGAFQRLHGMDEFEGTGIGLATVQRIIHRHGGRLWAEGAVNRGATFYFTLERPKEESHDRQDHSASGGQPRRRAVDPARPQAAPHRQ